MVGLNMCDWISCSSPVVLHVPSPYDHCALARKEGVGCLDPQAGGLGGLQRAQGSREVWRAAGRRPLGPCVYVCERMCVCVYVHLCMKVVYFVCLWCLFYLFCGLIRAGESWRLFEVF